MLHVSAADHLPQQQVIVVAPDEVTRLEVTLVEGSLPDTTIRLRYLGDAPSDEVSVSVSEALRLTDGTAVLVNGFMEQYIRESGSRTEVLLCGSTLDSYPPSCQPPRLYVDGLAIDDIPGVQESGSQLWVERTDVYGTIDRP